MQTKNFIVNDELERNLTAFLAETLSQRKIRSIWVQVFSGNHQRAFLQTLTGRLKAVLPENAVITGATTSGEVLEGQMFDLEAVVSVSCFTNATLKSAAIDRFYSFSTLGEELAKQLTDETTKAVVMFIDGLQINGEEVVKGFSRFVQGNPLLAGGMAGDNLDFEQTWLIHNDQVFERGAVAVALSGEDLEAFNAYNLSWQALGPKMVVTKSEGARVFEIDHRPVREVYRHYLGDDVVEAMPDSTIEFPLIIQDKEIPVARSMVNLFDDGSVLFAGNIEQDSLVRFGVADANALNKARTAMREEVALKEAQALFIYSCAARKAFLGNSLENELRPLAQVAPVAGFFTYGEVYHFNERAECSVNQNALLNVTTTVLGLRESSDVMNVYPISHHEQSAAESRNSLSNSALIRLVNQTTRELSNELEENNKLIQLLNQYQVAINDAFIVSKSDIYGTITYANSLFQKVSGYSDAELIGKNHNIVRHPEMSNAFFKSMWQTILGKSVWNGVIKNRAKDGSTYVVKTSIVPILDRKGDITEFLSLREDVTAQEAQRELLQEEKLKIQSILDNQSNLVIMTNASLNKMVTANQAFLDFTGFVSLKHFLQKYDCICDLFLPGKGLLQKSMDGIPWYEYVLKHPEQNHICAILSNSGEQHSFSVRVASFKGCDDNVVTNFADVTLLESARQRALQAEMAQSMFLANMSHELRTPINGILGFADLLANTDLDNEQKRFVDILRSSSRHLLSVVNDILDISKIERGEIELSIHPEQTFVDLEKILVSFSPVAQQKQVKYLVNLSPQLPECLLYDNMRLHQVLANLISNAVKFTPHNGQVNVDISVVSSTENQVWVRFSVQDTGIGIAEDKQTHVFENLNSV